eukprot:19590-Heterococcus_DN1.PRE.4
MPQAISESDSAHRSTVARARWHKGMAIVLARNVSCQHIANCCDTTVEQRRVLRQKAVYTQLRTDVK